MDGPEPVVVLGRHRECDMRVTARRDEIEVTQDGLFGDEPDQVRRFVFGPTIYELIHDDGNTTEITHDQYKWYRAVMA